MEWNSLLSLVISVNLTLGEAMKYHEARWVFTPTLLITIRRLPNQVLHVPAFSLCPLQVRILSGPFEFHYFSY